MSRVDTSGQLLGACRVLFGPGVSLDGRFLESLDLTALRRHFRRRATEVHPDRAAVLRKHPAVLAEAFKQVEAAYRTLCAHFAAGRSEEVARAETPTCRTARARAPQPRPRGTEQRRGSKASENLPGDHFWSGPVPTRILRLGEFLYYSGRIPWSELIRALAWQARLAPRFGQVASRYGYLTSDRIASILTRRGARERIGEAALRMGFITGLQQQVVLLSQSRARRRIGEYFVEAGLVEAKELDRLGSGLRAHNARVGLTHGCARSVNRDR